MCGVQLYLLLDETLLYACEIVCMYAKILASNPNNVRIIYWGYICRGQVYFNTLFYTCEIVCMHAKIPSSPENAPIIGTYTGETFVQEQYTLTPVVVAEIFTIHSSADQKVCIAASWDAQQDARIAASSA